MKKVTLSYLSKSQTLLSVIFAGLIILSTYTAIDTGSYEINTRLIGAMTAGLLGGPIVGLYSSFIGSVYVYLFSQPQAFAMASAFSTMLFGLLGGGFYPYFQRGKWKYKDLFLLACFAEVCDMVALLRLAVPFQMALETILEISVPMILINAAGLLVFISGFNSIFAMQDLESSRQLQRASELAKKCLPLLLGGVGDKENMQKLAETMLEEIDWVGVIITDRKEITGSSWRDGAEGLESGTDIPEIGKRVMETCELETMYQAQPSSPLYEFMKEYSLVAAPFIIQKQAIGCLIVWVKKKWVFQQSELELLQHLVALSSYQIALSELERQRTMRHRAEFKALQFQVNPHFLFNALNTISCVCRENPERARELLVTLATYFRYNLNDDVYMVPLEEELTHVKNYLEIEKARFEEKLQVSFHVPEQMDVEIPTLILQPIVENAVRYGVNQEGKRIVKISIEEAGQEYLVRISDEGRGIDADVVDRLRRGETIGNSIGLSNVHKRMKSIYGKDHGLDIISSDHGTCVELRFAKNGEEKNENRNN